MDKNQKYEPFPMAYQQANSGEQGLILKNYREDGKNDYFGHFHKIR